MEHNRPLKLLTTFKIGGPARAFVEITDPRELPEAFHYAGEVVRKAEVGGQLPPTYTMPPLILGGGSNMLVSDAGYNGLVIQIANRGIEVVGSGEDMLRVASGEVWDDVVKFAVEHGLWGIENLSRIPGRAGAVPVQNVGAYGQEIQNVLVNVEVFDRATNEFRTLSNEECQFTYRKSIFNTTEKNRYIILYMTLRLSLEPVRNLSYPDVKKWFEQNPEPTQQEIRDAIKAIRDRKFPFPAESIEGNAGSFFKNSTLTAEQYADLEARFAANLPEYLERLSRVSRVKSQGDSGPSSTLVPSAFILEACGLKGYHRGDVMLNPTQPVIVLNVTGEATADEVLSVVREVREIVKEKTGLHLYTEPELIGFTEKELRRYGFNDAEIERYIV